MNDTIKLLLRFEKEWYEEKTSEDDNNGVYDLPLPQPTLTDLFEWLRNEKA